MRPGLSECPRASYAISDGHLQSRRRRPPRAHLRTEVERNVLAGFSAWLSVRPKRWSEKGSAAARRANTAGDHAPGICLPHSTRFSASSPDSARGVRSALRTGLVYGT